MIHAEGPVRRQRTRRVAGRGAAHRRGVMLLETVVAIGILIVAIAVCGAVMRNSFLTSEHAERLTRAMFLTQGLLNELDTGLMEAEREQTGGFGEQGPEELSWRLEIVPDDQEPELLHFTATIYLGNPEGGESERQTILRTHLLRALPRKVNLKNDFGMTDEQITMLTDAIPGGEGMLDPENFDPSSLARLDMDSLVELLPTIMALMAGGQVPGGMGELQQLTEGGGGSGGRHQDRAAASGDRDSGRPRQTDRGGSRGGKVGGF